MDASEAYTRPTMCGTPASAPRKPAVGFRAVEMGKSSRATQTRSHSFLLPAELLTDVWNSVFSKPASVEAEGAKAQ